MTSTEKQPELNAARLKDEYTYGVGYITRWELYDHTDDGRSLHSEALGSLALKGQESVIDIGSGIGLLLQDLRNAGHEGQLVGVDLSTSPNKRSEQLGVHTITADASVNRCGHNQPRALPFKTSSFDVAMAMFMLYHVAAPEQTIREISRIVKPAGTIAIATSGPDNKIWHREFERIIAAYLKVDPPARYNSAFTVNDADELLPKIFKQKPTSTEQTTTITITAKDVEEVEQETYGQKDNVLMAYESSMMSMYQQYGEGEVGSTDVRRAFRKIVIPLIKNEIDATGVFLETVHRKLYTVRNSLK